jgi:hypothetical protein
VKIELLKPWMGRKEGTVLDLVPVVADRLIRTHNAAACVEEKPSIEELFEKTAGMGPRGKDKMMRQAPVQK